ncbi:MAG: iron-sulfur cluster assembly scaffold protein [Deltaproteobacteria bacterium]|nr:iron-sulfur cluster assembly scaffold protein [Deltaproteobacteria bacterium]
MGVDLYQDAIIALSRRSDHIGSVPDADCEAVMRNPLCGDQVMVQLQIEGGRIRSLRYQVRGCLLCKASSALLASLGEGMDLHELEEMHQGFDLALKTEDISFPVTHTVFMPVRAHKSRHSCILLPYEAVMEALSMHKKGFPEIASS